MSETITTYTDALQAIWQRSGYDRGFISNPFAGDDAARLGLVRTRELLNQMGHEQLPYAIVHVAGSKGKGSTTVMIDAMVHAAGYRVGRYMSPQLHSFRERFTVDNELIAEADFVTLTRTTIAAAEIVEQRAPEIGEITAFEISTAMAFAWFAMAGCDVAVIEVGLGGTLDATNIIDPSVSVITTLDYEHTAILGETMAEIAANKAGIIKQSRPVISARQPDDAMQVIADRASALSAPLAVEGANWQVTGSDLAFAYERAGHRLDSLRLALVGNHQVRNAGLAITAVHSLAAQSGLTIDETAIRAGLLAAQLPARFEVVTLDSGQTVVIDGAHTPASAAALAAAIQQRYPHAKLAIVIGLLADKNPEAVLSPLAELHPRWIATAPVSPRALAAHELHGHIGTTGNDGMLADSVAAGIAQAQQLDVELIVVTGSFITAAEARVALEIATVVDPPLS